MQDTDANDPLEKSIYQTWYTPKPWVSPLRRNTWCPMFGAPSQETPKSMFLYIYVIICTIFRHQIPLAFAHPGHSRIRVPRNHEINLVCQEIKDNYPKMAVLFWEIRGTWMLLNADSMFGPSTEPCWPGDIVDETIISGLHLIRQKTCIHLGLVAWNSWTVVDKPSNSGAKVV